MTQDNSFLIPIHCTHCRKYVGELFGDCGNSVLFYRFECHDCILKTKPITMKEQQQ